MKLRRKQTEERPAALACQLRTGSSHPFGGLKGYVPLGTGEERIYREIREAIPVLDAAVGKLVRLSGGFTVKCGAAVATEKLQNFHNILLNPCRRKWR